MVSGEVVFQARTLKHSSAMPADFQVGDWSKPSSSKRSPGRPRTSKRAIFFEPGLGQPSGPPPHMKEQDQVAHAHEAKRDKEIE